MEQEDHQEPPSIEENDARAVFQPGHYSSPMDQLYEEESSDALNQGFLEDKHSATESASDASIGDKPITKPSEV